MRTAAIVIVAALACAPAAAAPKKPPAATAPSESAKDSAERFSLDLPPVDEDSTVTVPAADVPPAPDTANAPAVMPRFTLDTPIVELIATRKSKAVLDRDMPGLSSDKNLDKFKALSLNRLAPLSGGRLSPTLLEKVGKDLAAIE